MRPESHFSLLLFYLSKGGNINVRARIHNAPVVKRLSDARIKLGACAYDWHTKRPSKWHQDPINDTEDFCRRLLDRALDSWGMYLREEEYNDTLSELIALVWKLEARFDPDKGQSFKQYAGWMVSQRAVDYGPRRVLGRHGTRTHNYVSQDFDEGDRMGESIHGFSLDNPEDRDSDVGRVLRERDREISRHHHELGLSPDGQTTLGNREDF